MRASHLVLALRGRAHPSYAAFVVHRLSGVALALFLPLHFWVLGSAIEGEAALEGALRWTDGAWVKAAETALVVLFAAHLAGGLRVLAIEFLAVRAGDGAMIGAGAAGALGFGLLFLLGLGS